MAKFINTLHSKPTYNIHRLITGAPIVAESANLNTILAEQPYGAIDCGGYLTIKGAVEIVAPAASTVSLLPLELVNTTDSIGQYFIAGSVLGPFSDGDMFEFTIDNGKVLFTLSAVTGAPTQVTIRLAGSSPSPALTGGSR